MVSASCSTTSTVLPMIAQMRQRIEQPVVVARMQPDGRLVQHVQHAAQLRPDLRRQADALRFAAGKRGRGTLQAQVIQPHRARETPAGCGFHPPRAPAICVSRSVNSQLRTVTSARAIGMLGELGDGEALDPHRQAGRAAAACRGKPDKPPATCIPSAIRDSRRPDSS